MRSASPGFNPFDIARPLIEGRPEQILAHVAQLARVAVQLKGLLDEFKRAQEQLRAAWPGGSAAEAATKKLDRSFEAYEGILQCISGAVHELEQAAAQLHLAHTAYSTVVTKVDPVVGALLAGIFTRPAATALTVSTTGILQAFIMGVAQVLQSSGKERIGRIHGDVAKIIADVEHLTPDIVPRTPPFVPAGEEAHGRHR